jgi:prevent-host-death family protein
MEKRYSIFEAKAKLSEIIRLIKTHVSITITERGVPVAIVSPYQELEQNAEMRLNTLVKAAKTRPAKGHLSDLDINIKRDGALKRFLSERD